MSTLLFLTTICYIMLLMLIGQPISISLELYFRSSLECFMYILVKGQWKKQSCIWYVNRWKMRSNKYEIWHILLSNTYTKNQEVHLYYQWNVKFFGLVEIFIWWICPLAWFLSTNHLIVCAFHSYISCDHEEANTNNDKLVNHTFPPVIRC